MEKSKYMHWCKELSIILFWQRVICSIAIYKHIICSENLITELTVFRSYVLPHEYRPKEKKMKPHHLLAQQIMKIWFESSMQRTT